MIDISKIFCDESDKLIPIKDEDGDYIVEAYIVDVELDTIKCHFNNDNAVVLNTSELEYLVLDINNLNTLKKLIKEAEKFYKIQYSK
jgi:hypothetical protein